MPCKSCGQKREKPAPTRASAGVIASRRDVCRACDHSEKRDRRDGAIGLTTFSKCDVCSCPIAGKTADISGKCPEGKW